MKQSLTLLLILCTLTACGSSVGDRLLGDRNIQQVAATATPLSIKNIQINQARILPPFGLKVKADVAALKLRVSSSQTETTGRLAAIQEVVEQIDELAAEQDAVEMQYISVSRVSSSSDRDKGVSSYIFEGYDSSSVILKLTTNLADQNHNLLASLILFNDFLETVNLPDTITIDTLSIETEISDPEIYREQLMAEIYQEVEAIQAEYGESVKFSITDVHRGLQTIPLTDTEYYLYLEPTIVVNEF